MLTPSIDTKSSFSAINEAISLISFTDIAKTNLDLIKQKKVSRKLQKPEKTAKNLAKLEDEANNRFFVNCTISLAFMFCGGAVTKFRNWSISTRKMLFKFSKKTNKKNFEKSLKMNN